MIDDYMKSLGVNDCVKWMKRKIKEEMKELERRKEDRRMFGFYEDCGESYQSAVERQEARIEAMVEIKIGLEKYAKKLRHMANEFGTYLVYFYDKIDEKERGMYVFKADNAKMAEEVATKENEYLSPGRFKYLRTEKA